MGSHLLSNPPVPRPISSQNPKSHAEGSHADMALCTQLACLFICSCLEPSLLFCEVSIVTLVNLELITVSEETALTNQSTNTTNIAPCSALKQF